MPAHERSPSMLETRNLRARYGKTDVLHSISAAFEPGKLSAVTGPNGCGKSTLLKCIAGLIRLSGGEILLNGKPLPAIPDQERAKFISYMPQSRAVPEISVQQLAEHGRYPHLSWGQSLGTADREIVNLAIERAGLSRLRHKSIPQLSGGERQRAYIAMMLAQQTPILVLDEPGTYLDIAARFELMALLQELRNEGRCIVVVLHELSLALENCDRILLMQDGRLLQDGSPEAVYGSGKLEEVFGVNVRQNEVGKYIVYPGNKTQ